MHLRCHLMASVIQMICFRGFVKVDFAHKNSHEISTWLNGCCFDYQAKCANALFASAMRCTFSRRFMATPSLP
jgi:hypothetical protein